MEKIIIKAVFLDLDDTLVMTSQIHDVCFQTICQHLQHRLPSVDGIQLTEEWKQSFYTVPWDPEQKIEVEEWRALLWHRCLIKQGHDNLELATELQELFTTTRMSNFTFAPGVLDLIAALRHTQGLKCIVITNGHAAVQRLKVKSCKADEYFDGVLIGGEEELTGGKQKPSPCIFLKACDLAGCQPSEAIMVGDSLTADIQGGINAGLAATVWVNPDGEREWEEGMPKPTFVVGSVLELPGVLKQLEARCA